MTTPTPYRCPTWAPRDHQWAVNTAGTKRMCACGLVQPLSGPVSPPAPPAPNHTSGTQRMPSGLDSGPELPKGGTQAATVLAKLQEGPVCATTLLAMYIPRGAAAVYRLRQGGWVIGTRDCTQHTHHNTRQIEYYLERQGT